MKAITLGLRKTRFEQNLINGMMLMMFVLVVISTAAFADKKEDEDGYEKQPVISTADQSLITIERQIFEMTSTELTASSNCFFQACSRFRMRDYKPSPTQITVVTCRVSTTPII